MPPKLNRKRALFVLTKIDEILAGEKQKETERDTRFVDLGTRCHLSSALVILTLLSLGPDPGSRVDITAVFFSGFESNDGSTVLSV